jgi:hypothetical protein
MEPAEADLLTAENLLDLLNGQLRKKRAAAPLDTAALFWLALRVETGVSPW